MYWLYYKVKKVKKIFIMENNISSNGLKRIKENLPNCLICIKYYPEGKYDFI